MVNRLQLESASVVKLTSQSTSTTSQHLKTHTLVAMTVLQGGTCSPEAVTIHMQKLTQQWRNIQGLQGQEVYAITEGPQQPQCCY